MYLNTTNIISKEAAIGMKKKKMYLLRKNLALGEKGRLYYCDVVTNVDIDTYGH